MLGVQELFWIAVIAICLGIFFFKGHKPMKEWLSGFKGVKKEVKEAMKDD